MSIQRASRQQPANPHRAGHYSGMHPEDQQYLSDELEEDDRYYVQRPPTSARRYYDTSGNQVIQQGNKRLVIHQSPPPARKMHWSLTLGLGMVLALLLWMAASEALAWWGNHELDSQYGMPRTYQTDALVYAADTQAHPSHYIFLNLNGQIMIVELPQGDQAHAKIYKGPTLVTDNADLLPVTGEFRQVNGKEEMIVHIGSQEIVYINDGTQFKPLQ